MIELAGIVLKSEDTTRLNGCQLSIRSGEVVGLIGRTGTGKTSLLKVCAGRVSPTRGQIRMDGRDVSRQIHRLRSAAGYLDKEIPGPHDLPVKEWLNFWAEMSGISSRERGDVISRSCGRFGALIGDRVVSSLSDGELKRLNLARIWIQSPRFFVLDSPSRDLDGEGLGRLSTAIEEASASGVTVLFSDSNPHLPVSVCDRVVVVADGRITAELSRADPQFEAMIASAQGWAQ